MKNIIKCMLLFVGVAVFSLPFAAQANERPNIILINIDNHDKASLGFYGNDFIETPNIDDLIRSGVEFTTYFVSGACSASRSSLMTGRQPIRNGVLATEGGWGQTREGIRTVAEILRDGGYQTAMFGKWHMGITYPLRPEDRGFEHTVWADNGGNVFSNYARNKGYDPKSPKTATAFQFATHEGFKDYKGFRYDIWFNELTNFIDQRSKDKPFFAYLATMAMHNPQYGPKDLRDKYKAKYAEPKWNAHFENRFRGKRETLEERPVYNHAASMEGVDRNVGKLIKGLMERGLYENTIVIYMSDGAGGGSASRVYSDPEEELRILGQPRSTIFTISWPKKLKAGSRVTALAGVTDLLPTLASIAGVTLAKEYLDTIDGRDWSPLLGLSNKPWEERVFVDDRQGMKFESGNTNFNSVMAIRPGTRGGQKVYFPDGSSVNIQGLLDPNTRGSRPLPDDQKVRRAEEIYQAYFEELLAEFPLGAYASAGEGLPVTYVEPYAIKDGPAGKGWKYYFLVKFEHDGAFKFEVNDSDQFGRPYEAAPKTNTRRVALFHLTEDKHLPVEWDSELKVYRVLPATLKKAFRPFEDGTYGLPHNFNLMRGKYLFHIGDGTPEIAGKTTVRIEYSK